jgi:transposase
MSLATAKIPSDPAELQAFAAALQSEYATLEVRTSVLQSELYAKSLHIEKLKAQLAILKRARYGRSSEKMNGEIEQLELLISDLEEGEARSQAQTSASQSSASPATSPVREKGRPVRKALPAHLPRETVEHEAACACPACGGTRLTKIGTDEREVLEYVPAHFKVIVHSRPKMSCRDCETITQPPMPSLPIERGIPGPGLLAHVMIAKYCDHLPLYRQSEIYARGGVDIDRSTLAGWVGKMSFLLDPLVEAVRLHVCAGIAIHADDTPVPVLEPGRGQTREGRLWVAVRDERPWGSSVPPAAFYRYSPDRKKEHAWALLKDCSGFLHADAYAGFNQLYKPDPLTGTARLVEVACWSHARRYIFDVHADTKSPAAYLLLQKIGELFAIEADICGRPPEERLAVRTALSVPLLAALKTEYEKTLGRVGKGTFATALRYALTLWDALTRYTTDGRLDICNNAAERAVRPLALGRRNWLFAGADIGGESAASMYTLIQTAKINGLDPEAYLRAVITRIADHRTKSIDQLMPWNIVL